MIGRIRYWAQRLLVIPNVPFLYGPILQTLVSILEEDLQIPFVSALSIQIRYPEGQKKYPSLAVWSIDEFALYVYIRRGQRKKLTIVDTHLDHPGFVSDGEGHALALGSVGFKRLYGIKREYPVKIFDLNGKLIDKALLYGGGRPRSIRPMFPLSVRSPLNASIIWDLPFFEEGESGVWRAYTADNQIATSVALTLLEEILNLPQDYPDVHALFVFPFVEEIFEIGATMFALRGGGGALQFLEDTFIIVLEAMQVVPLKASRPSDLGLNLEDLRIQEDDQVYSDGLLHGISNDEDLHPAYFNLDFPLPNPHNGLLIKHNDIDIPYALRASYKDNKALAYAVSLAQNLGLKFQATISGGACNGTAYSLFTRTPNIITLVIPTFFKHNIGLEGEVVMEEVKRQDVVAMLRLLKAWFKFDQNQLLEAGEVFDVKDILRREKLFRSAFAQQVNLRRLQRERKAVAYGSLTRLRRRVYYPRNAWEKGLIVYDRLRSRLVY